MYSFHNNLTSLLINAQFINDLEVVLNHLAAVLDQKQKQTPPSLSMAQPDTYMITFAGAGSLLGRRGRRGRGGGRDSSGRSDRRGRAGGWERRGRGGRERGGGGGGEERRYSSRKPGLLTDLTGGQRGVKPSEISSHLHITSQLYDQQLRQQQSNK